MKKKMKLAWLPQYRVAVTGTFRRKEHRMVMDVAAESKPKAVEMARTAFKSYWTCHKITSVSFALNCYHGYELGDILVERN